MKMSDYGKLVLEKQVTANTMLARPDNITSGGWSMIEMASMIKRTPVNGFNTDDLMLKMTLFHNVLSHEVDGNFIPYNNYAALDQRTVPDLTQPIQIVWNVPGSQFGESCGGATALFPFLNVAGSVAFHLSETTVPLTERQNIVYCPTNLVSGSDRDGENLALFVRMWAPYPCHMARIRQYTDDTAGGNNAIQNYVPKANLVQVAGLTTIHVILPRNTSTRTPTTQAEANNSALFRPSTGDIASTSLAADAFLDICYLGIGGFTSYNLCEYLYTWLQAHDPTTLTLFLGQLQAIFGIKDSLERMQEVADYYTVAAPTMPFLQAGDATTFTYNTTRQMACTDIFGVTESRTVADWPQTSNTKPDMVIHQCEQMSWNLIVTNLYDPTVYDSEVTTLPEGWGNSRAIWWSILRTMQMGAVWSSHISELGWDTTCWDTAYTQTNMTSFRNHIQGYYCALSNRGVMGNAKWGPMLAKFFSATTGHNNALYKQDNISISFWDRRIPTQRAHGPVVVLATGAIVSAVIPVTLPDVWINILLKAVPKYQMALPPPGSIHGTKGFNAGLVHFRPSQNVVGSWIQPDTVRPGMTANENVLVNGDTRWNDRLMYLLGHAVQTLSTGAAPPNVPAADTFPCQRRIALPGWIRAFPATNEYSWSTICMPCTTYDGMFVHATTTAANASTIISAQGRNTTLPNTAWQIAKVLAGPDIPTDVGKIKSPWEEVATYNDLKPQKKEGEGDEKEGESSKN